MLHERLDVGEGGGMVVKRDEDKKGRSCEKVTEERLGEGKHEEEEVGFLL